MLILLTLIYCGIIWLVFFKLKILPWNKVSRNASVLVGVAGLMAVLIGMVQGSPTTAGGIQVNARVMELAAHSFGRVVDVPVDTYQPLKKGDVILRVDDTQYKARVAQLEAQLAAAINGVEKMKEALRGAEADVKNVEAQIEIWRSSLTAASASRAGAEAALEGAKASLDAAKADVAASASTVKTAEIQIARIRALLAKDVVPEAEVDSAENKVVGAKAAYAAAQAAQRRATEDVSAKRAGVDGAVASEQQTKDQLASLEAQLAKARAVAEQAKLQVESTIDGEHTSVRQAKAQLADARYDLVNTVVRAPTDGYIAAFGVTEGDYVRMMSFGSYVVTGERFATAMFPQTVVRHIKPGQKAEIAFRSQPGVIVPAVVDAVIWGSGEAQVPTSGQFPMVNQVVPGMRVGVRFTFPPEAGFVPEFGASGQVAIYTDHAKPIQIIRKIVLRMSSLLYYLGIG